MTTVVDTYELSPMQQGMVFHSLESSEPGVDVEHVVCHMDEAVDSAALLRAWGQVVQRHGILRTRFRIQDTDQPLQDVFREVDLPFEQLDWQNVPGGEQEERWCSLLSADRRRGFDLSRPPLLRLVLVAFGNGHFRLLWSFHHALLDGRSFPLVLHEVLALYDADRDGRTVDLPSPRPYGAYIHWLRGLDLERAEDFWRGALKGFSAPTALGLPQAADQGGQPNLGAGAHEVRLSVETTARLASFARDHGLTLNILVQGAWAVLLHRYSREPEVVFGATRACRRSALEGAEQMIGLFINTLPVRVAVDSSAPLVPWLRSLRESQAGVRDYEHTPLSRVQAWSDVPPGTALFQTLAMFDYATLDARMHARDGAWNGRRFDYVGQTNFDVALLAYGDPEMLVRLEYYRRAVDDEAARQMLGHFRRLLEAMPDHGERPVGALPLLTEPERQQIVEQWNNTGRAYPLDRCLHQLIEAQVARTPERIAVEADEGCLTYRELDDRANQLARFLRGLGVSPGDLVGIAMERSVEMVVGLLGILKSGGAYVPLDPAYPKDRLAFMMDDARPRVLLTQQRLVASLPDRKAPVVALDTRWPEIARESPLAPAPVFTSDSLAYVIFTSGSTGRPKGAMNEHRGIVNRLLWMQDEYGLTADDAVLQKTTYSFDVSVWEFFWPLLAGARLVMARPEGHKDPGYLVRTIVERGITTVHFVPTMLQVFLEEPGVEDCVSLRRVICSGEALSADLRDRFFERLGCELHNLYGPTEAAVDVTFHACRRGERRRSVPIGRPVANTQIYVLDSRLEPVPIGVAGELHIGGVQVGCGYLARPELTAERFVPDPFGKPGTRLYKTGDLARFLPDGSVEYLGRMDHQVKIRGFRIELGEIEAVMQEHPSVRESVVVVREDRPGDPRLVGYYVADPDAHDLEAVLRARLLAKLPEYMLPSALVRLDAIPRLSNGKVARRDLPAPDRESRSSGSQYVVPLSATEEALSQIWASVLGRTRVGAEDNFFDLGGNSILMIQVIAQARRRALQFTPLTMFRYPTVRSLAAHLTGEGADAPRYERVQDRARRQREALARRQRPRPRN